jgi:hypothetical protein
MITSLPPVPENNELSFTWRDWFKKIKIFLDERTFNGNTKYGSMRLPPLAGRPSNRTAGQFAMIYTTGGSTDARTATPRPMYTDGTDWRKFVDDTVWAG